MANNQTVTVEEIRCRLCDKRPYADGLCYGHFQDSRKQTRPQERNASQRSGEVLCAHGRSLLNACADCGRHSLPMRTTEERASAYVPGKPVQVLAYGQTWRDAIVTKPERYERGDTDGAYVVYDPLPIADPVTRVQPSTGGWFPANCIRERAS